MVRVNTPAPLSEPATSTRTRVTWVRRYGGPLRRLKILVRLRRLYLLQAELKWAPTESQRLFALTVAIGVLCGLAAVAFHLTISLLEYNLIDRALGASGNSWIAWTILVPTLGGIVCGLLLDYVVPTAHGIPRLNAATRL